MKDHEKTKVHWDLIMKEPGSYGETMVGNILISSDAYDSVTEYLFEEFPLNSSSFFEELYKIFDRLGLRWDRSQPRISESIIWGRNVDPLVFGEICRAGSTDKEKQEKYRELNAFCVRMFHTLKIPKLNKLIEEGKVKEGGVRKYLHTCLWGSAFNHQMTVGREN